MIDNVDSTNGIASISGDTITVENVGANVEDTLTITHNTSAADVVSGASYTITDAGDSTTDTATFNLVGATGVTAEAVDVTVSGDTAEVNVSHSDNPDQTEIALYDDAGNLVDNFDTANDGSGTPGLDAVMTGDAGNTTFVFNTQELNSTYDYELGSGMVYAASQSADDSFGTVNDMNNQVQSEISLNGLLVNGFEGADGEIVRVAANDTEVTYEVTVKNTGANEVTQDVSIITSSNATNPSIGTPTNPQDTMATQSVTVASGTEKTVELTFNTGNLPDSSENIADYEIGAYTEAPSGNTPHSLETTNLKVGSSTEGSITITVVDDASNRQGNVNVELWLESDFDSQSLVLRNKTTNQNGEVTFTGLAVGSDNSNPIRYTARAGAAQDDLSSTTTTLELYETTQTSDSSTVVTERLIQPKRLDVVQDKHTAVADGDDQITFTATVFGDTSGVDPANADELMEDVDVTISHVADSVAIDGAVTDSVTKQTNADGEVTFTVSSDNVQTVDFNFEAGAGDTDALTQTETKQFVLSGKGNLGGVVYDQSTTNGLENADVWVVSEDQYTTNENQTTIDLTTLEAGGEEMVWVRLVDNETNSIIDNDEYDLRQGEGDDGTHVRKVEALNTTDAAVGQGYALIDSDGDDEITFNHTRIAPENYYVQVSFDAWNASTAPEVIDDNQEDFWNVTGVNNNGLVTSTQGTSQVVFTPTANLTVDATANLAETTGANYVDSPGFVNSPYGVDTDGTNDNGQFALNKLPTNFQNGTGYVAITTKTGYTTDFADVTVTEDGELTFTEQQGTNELFVEPVPVDPDGVDIQQVGTYENASGQASLINFTDASDDTFQEVPRDGSTVDVFVVNTTAEGTPVNATAEVSFANASVAGNFVAIESGQYESRDNGTNTATISTGNDGQAVVWYQVDQGNTQVDTRKTATLTNDLSVTDYSNVTFLPVLEAESGEVSGIVTDSENNPVPAVVYTKDLTVAGTDFTVKPAAADMSEFNITRYDGSGNAVESAIVTRSQAENYDFQVDKDGNPVFPSISLASSVSDLTLVTESTSGVGEASSYTLPRVPTTDNGPNEVAVAATSLASFDSPSSLNDLVTGQAVTTATEPNRTATSNVEISGAQAAQFAVSDPTVTPENATQGETVTVEATVSNVGAVTASTEVRYLFGDRVANATEQDSVTTSPIVTGDSETVTFTLDTSGVEPGDYVNLVETDDYSANADVTIEDGGNNGNWYDAYVNETTGVVEDTGLNDAIKDALNDDLSDTRLNTVITSYLGGEPIADQ